MPPTTPPLTLVILAAGRSTRFGRLKQLTPIGPGGAALLDYALYDAALAGFSRFLLVIQEELRGDFDAHLHPAAAAGLDLRYVYQSLAHPGLVDHPPPGRTRPWGTGHAVLTAAEHIDGPFALCNADDFYGRGAYAALAEAMRGARAPTPTPALTVGYPLEVTLSESGGVSRGICQIDDMGALQRLTEGLGMRRAGNRVQGRDVTGRQLNVPLDAFVCTNLWGFPETPNVGSTNAAEHAAPETPGLVSAKAVGQDSPEGRTPGEKGQLEQRDRFDIKSVQQSVQGIVSHLRRLFAEFLASNPGTDYEYYLSEAMSELIARGLVHCQVLPTQELWLGVTFPGDHARVAESLRALVDSKVYPRSLWDSPPAPPSD